MVPKTIDDFSEYFHSKNLDPNGIHWMITWNLGVVAGDKLWTIFRLAMPHEAELDEKYCGSYEEVYEWIKENINGLWTHSQVMFFFEKKDDALAFKLRWT